jgi:hypothetical protein
MKDGSLSPVFNIRGATNIPTISNFYCINEEFNKKEPNLGDILESIDYSEEDFMIVGGKAPNENAKGVIQLSYDPYKEDIPFPVIGIHIYTHYLVTEELKKYVKGFFFVR